MTVFKVIDELALQVLALVAEELQCVGLADVGTHDVLVLLREFHHLLLNLGEVSVGQRGVTGVDVIIETVLDGRANTELHAGVQLLQGLGQQVRRRVPEGVLALGVFPLEELDIAIHTNGA